MSVLRVKAREAGENLKEIRDSGVVPGVVYGYQIKPQSIKVGAKDLEAIYAEAGESVLFDLAVEGNKEELKVVINELSRDPLTGDSVHVDFYRANLGKPIEAEVELNFVGEPPLIKSEGAIVIKSVDSVEVKALPLEMLKTIDVDMGALKTYDDVIHVSDLSVEGKIEILDNPEKVIASLTPPRSEEELDALEEAVEADVDDVEVEEKGKKEEEEAIDSPDGDDKDDSASQEGEKSEDKKSETEEKKK